MNQRPSKRSDNPAEVASLEQLVQFLTSQLAESGDSTRENAESRSLVQTILDAVTASGVELKDTRPSEAVVTSVWQAIGERLGADEPIRLRELMAGVIGSTVARSCWNLY